MQFAELLDQEIGPQRFWQAEQRRRKLLDPAREPARFRVHQSPRRQAALLACNALKASEPALELIKDPEIELLHAGQDGGFALGAVALALRGGARLRFWIGRRALLLKRSRDRNLGSGVCLVGRGPACSGSAPPRQPIVHPVGLWLFVDGATFGAHPHQGQRMLAGKFPARARALVAKVGLGDHDAIGLRSGALAFTPDEPGIAAGNHRPAPRIEQLSCRAQRALVGRDLLDLCQRQTHRTLAVPTTPRA